MSSIVLMFALIMLIVGTVVLVKPMAVFELLNSHSRTLTLHLLAVVVRLLLGVSLIAVSHDSRFPTVLEVLGWISIAAGVVLLAIGRKNFTSVPGLTGTAHLWLSINLRKINV